MHESQIRRKAFWSWLKVSALPVTLLAFHCSSADLALADDAAAGSSAHADAPTATTGSSVSSGGTSNGGGNTTNKQGELDVTIKSTNKMQVTVGKLDPPAAFNLEDIQNFPEDRLQPVLNNPLTFEEGRDFSSMMDFQHDQLAHPWLPEVSKAPYLVMKPVLDKPAKEWTFSVIDQSGTPVTSQQGKGSPPTIITWNGDDSVRGLVAVDTVYIPQLATTDKDGYHHTYTGQPAQFSSLSYMKDGKPVVELSSKRLFQENKAEFTKEAPVLLDKVSDVIREDGHLPFAIQAYDNNEDLARSREQAMIKYFSDTLYIPDTQIVALSPLSPEKRGTAIAIMTNTGSAGGTNP